MFSTPSKDTITLKKESSIRRITKHSFFSFFNCITERTFMGKKGTRKCLVSVAPMMDVTDRSFRNLLRFISKHAVLYTEMLVDNVILHASPEKLEQLLLFEHFQNPVILQVGGNDPKKVAEAVHIAHKLYPYDGYNLNCGCPSHKTTKEGLFGAVLMQQPEKVGEIAAQVADTIGQPISVKCRIGVDQNDSFEFLSNFIQKVSTIGAVEHFIIHARSAWLSGISPKENRSKPPIKYEYVYRLVKEFPHLRFTLNGQVSKLEDIHYHLSRDVQGVMIGRAVMNQPWNILKDIDSHIYGDDATAVTRKSVLEKYIEYLLEIERKASVPRHCLVKPCLNLFSGEMNSRKFRRLCSEYLQKGCLASDVLRYAMVVLPEQVLEQESGSKELVSCTEPSQTKHKYPIDMSFH
eukprot:jgi/Galph1/1971/GphlegSOOS_G665.1